MYNKRGINEAALHPVLIRHRVNGTMCNRSEVYETDTVRDRSHIKVVTVVFECIVLFFIYTVVWVNK